MKRYISIYIALLKINYSRMLMYRSNFIVGTFSTLLWAVFSVVVILLLTYKTKTVFGWTTYELLLLTAVVNIVLGLFRMFFDRNFVRFSHIVYEGELDSVLIKPLDSQFFISVWYINFYNIFRVLFAIGLTIYFLLSFHIPIMLPNVIVAVVLMLFGLSSLYAITYILLTFTIWFPRLSNLLAFEDIYTGTIRYPKEMFQNLGILTYSFLLPIILTVSLPTRFLLNKPDWTDTIILLVSAILLIFTSHIFWKFALRYYTSTSS